MIKPLLYVLTTLTAVPARYMNANIYTIENKIKVNQDSYSNDKVNSIYNIEDKIGNLAVDKKKTVNTDPSSIDKDIEDKIGNLANALDDLKKQIYLETLADDNTKLRSSEDDCDVKPKGPAKLTAELQNSDDDSGDSEIPEYQLMQGMVDLDSDGTPKQDATADAIEPTENASYDEVSQELEEAKQLEMEVNQMKDIMVLDEDGPVQLETSVDETTERHLEALKKKKKKRRVPRLEDPVFLSKMHGCPPGTVQVAGVCTPLLI